MKIIECGKDDIDYTSFLRIQWSITNLCNYKCYYCNTHNADETYSDINTINTIINFINQLSETRNTDIRLFGGEPTLHPYFSEIINNIHVSKPILVWTNLSRPLSFYSSISKYSLRYRCSYHPKYSNIDEFKTKLFLLLENPNNSIFVNVMVSYNNMDEVLPIYNMFTKLRDQYKNFNCSLDKIYYSKEQFSKINELKFNIAQKDHIDNGYYIKFMDGTQCKKTKVSYNTITNNKWNNFYLFKCYTIRNSIFIDYNGDVYNCVTYKTAGFKPFFNILQNDITEYSKFLNTNNYCQSKTCTCEFDIKKIRGKL